MTKQPVTRLLLVEDDEDDFLLTSDVLTSIRNLRFEVTWADSYEKACGLAENDTFDIYLVDYFLGARTGLDFVGFLLARDLRAPVILLTSADDFSQVDKDALAMGVDDFLPKSEINAVILERTICYALEHKRMVSNLLESESSYRALAEFATTTIHNIGNIINSMGIAVETAQETTKKMNVVGAHRMAALMISKQKDLGSFLESDKGRKMPTYLSELAQHFQNSRERVLKEIEEVVLRLDLVKDLIYRQQEQAKYSMRMTTIDIEEVVSEVLRVKLSRIAQLKVKVVRRIDEEHTRVVINRTALVHTLLNLVKNALDAMEESVQRVLEIRTRKDGERVILTVTDTGKGISPEHLDKLFTFGFTTKKDGHGFGLNFCYKSMASMGGDIRVFSEGAGKGATFEIVFPMP